MNRTLPLALAIALGAACAHERNAPAATTSAQASTAPAPAQDATGMCPMSVPGTTVSAGDTPDGATLTFTTTTAEQVPALREKVAAMAAMHNRHHAAAMEEHGTMHGSAGGMEGDVHGSTGAGGMHGDMHGSMGGMGGSMGSGMGGAMTPAPATASVEDVDGGARLVLTPADPADLARLQSTVRAHAEQMQRDGCGMMMQRRPAP